MAREKSLQGTQPLFQGKQLCEHSQNSSVILVCVCGGGGGTAVSMARSPQGSCRAGSLLPKKAGSVWLALCLHAGRTDGQFLVTPLISAAARSCSRVNTPTLKRAWEDEADVPDN